MTFIEAILWLLIVLGAFVGVGYHLFKRLRKLESVDMLSTFEQYLLIIYVGLVMIVIRTVLGDERYFVFWGMLVVALVLGMAWHSLWGSANAPFAENARGRRWQILRDKRFFIPHVARAVVVLVLIVIIGLI